MIQLREVSRSFEGTDAPAVDDLTIDVRPGETLVLLGSSGCGKTTTLKMINRLIEPTSGTVMIDGAGSVICFASTARGLDAKNGGSAASIPPAKSPPAPAGKPAEAPTPGPDWAASSAFADDVNLLTILVRQDRHIVDQQRIVFAAA